MITKYTEYIKESLNSKQSIKEWLDKMNIKNYTINKDLTVDVDGDVDISWKELTEIPVKFNKVKGSFDCYNNKLTSLEGCPTNINGDFYCYDNKLTSLEFCPNIVNGYFNCENNSNLIDINHLDSKILIKSIYIINVKEEVYDKYFEHWIDKDINIVKVLKDKVSNKRKENIITYLMQIILI